MADNIASLLMYFKNLLKIFNDSYLPTLLFSYSSFNLNGQSNRCSRCKVCMCVLLSTYFCLGFSLYNIKMNHDILTKVKIASNLEINWISLFFFLSECGGRLVQAVSSGSTMHIVAFWQELFQWIFKRFPFFLFFIFLLSKALFQTYWRTTIRWGWSENLLGHAVVWNTASVGHWRY